MNRSAYCFAGRVGGGGVILGTDGSIEVSRVLPRNAAQGRIFATLGSRKSTVRRRNPRPVAGSRCSAWLLNARTVWRPARRDGRRRDGTPRLTRRGDAGTV